MERTRHHLLRHLPLGAILLAICAVSCAARSPHPPPTGRARIEAACTLTATGADCTFTNRGGRGSDCVEIHYGAPGRSRPITAVECAGPLEPGETEARSIRFERAPAEVCGASLSECTSLVTTRSEDPRRTVEAVLAWWRQAEASRGRSARSAGAPLTVAACEAVARHILGVAEAHETPQQVARLRRIVVDARASFVLFCLEHMPPSLYECVAAATTPAEMTRCGPDVTTRGGQ